jgi:hypothetical protein
MPKGDEALFNPISCINILIKQNSEYFLIYQINF